MESLTIEQIITILTSLGAFTLVREGLPALVRKLTRRASAIRSQVDVAITAKVAAEQERDAERVLRRTAEAERDAESARRRASDETTSLYRRYLIEQGHSELVEGLHTAPPQTPDRSQP